MMTTVTWKQLQRVLITHLERARVLLDIGCGINPQNMVLTDVHICVEPFHEYAEHLLKDRHKRNYVVLNCGWRDAVQVLPPLSVDTICLVDVVEHLEKAEGVELLRKTIALARRQVVVITPHGFMPQHHEDGKDIWGMSGGEGQEHRSGWDEHDFDERWQVYVVPEHYKTDNQGRALVPPNGFMLAILNIGRPSALQAGTGGRLAEIFKDTYHLLLRVYRLVRLEVRNVKERCTGRAQSASC